MIENMKTFSELYFEHKQLLEELDSARRDCLNYYSTTPIVVRIDRLNNAEHALNEWLKNNLNCEVKSDE